MALPEPTQIGRYEVVSRLGQGGMAEKREFFVPRPGNPTERVLSVVEFGLDKEGKPSQRLFYRPDGQFDHAERLRP